MSNYRKNLLKKLVKESPVAEIEKLLGQQSVEIPTIEKSNHPQMKLSKRMKKKLERTGRTSTKQKIAKTPKLPPLTKPKAELPKVGPKPKSPKLPKKPEKPKTPMADPAPKNKPLPLPNPPKNPKVGMDVQDLDDATFEDLINDKHRLIEVLVENNDFLTGKGKELLRDALYDASLEEIDDILKLMPSDDWKDFYKWLSGQFEGNTRNEDFESIIEEICDLLEVDIDEHWEF